MKVVAGHMRKPSILLYVLNHLLPRCFSPEGAVLNPHVDRLPLVSSCIINVAQDVDEDWPLEVYDRHDRAVNVTMKPGDIVLYESGSLVHGE